jgi:hypothetical protein
MGSLITYMKGEWTETTPTQAEIKWNEDWFNTKELMYPQVIVSNAYSMELESWNTGGSLDMRHEPRYLVNIGHFIKTGSPGTLELTRVENIRREIRRIFLAGWSYSPHYGGSLNPLRVVLPRGSDRSLHDKIIQPALLRYELTLVCTEDIG